MTKQMMVVLALLAYVLVHGFIIEPNSLQVKRYRIEDSYLQGIKVAFLSDFHLKRRDYNRLDKIVNLTNRVNPDVVILGGDYVTGMREKDTMNTEIIAQKLSFIKAPTYAILGENDWKVNGVKVANSFISAGIRVLENNNVRIAVKRRYIDIIGLADLEKREPKIAQAMRRTMQPRIVVTHNPDVYYDIVDQVSLILAGHTHGGQFVIPFAKPIFVNSRFGGEFASGLVKKTVNTMIVSRGLGMTGIPIRMNCKPEIVLVEFVRADNTDTELGKD